MKILLLFILTTLSISYTNAQNPTIIFEKVGDVQKNKNIIYSETKDILAKDMIDSHFVIQNEDTDAGTIEAKGLAVLKVKQSIGLYCVYNYTYTVNFRLRDDKYNIIISDVTCTKAITEGLGSSSKVPLIQPFNLKNKDIPKTRFMGKGISKKQAIALMVDLNKQLSDIIDTYSNLISK